MEPNYLAQKKEIYLLATLVFGVDDVDTAFILLVLKMRLFRLRKELTSLSVKREINKVKNYFQNSTDTCANIILKYRADRF